MMSWRRYVGLALGFTLMGCAAGKPTSGGEMSAGPTKKAVDKDDPEVMADQKFDDLSAQLASTYDGKNLDEETLERDLKGVLKIHSDHSAARFNLGVLKDRQGDVKGAKKIYKRVLDEDSDFAPAAENLAAFSVDAGDVGKAVKVYKRFIHANPRNITSRLALARIELERKEYKKAIALARQVLQRQADAIEAFRILATSYLAIGDVPMAELIIARGFKAKPDDDQLHYLLAEIHLDRNELSAGIGKLKEIVARRPQWLRARGRIADIALTYRDYGNAATHLSAILEIQPKDRNARLAMAVAHRGLGRYEQARETYEALLSENNADADAWWNLAILQHRYLQKFDDAAASYKKAKTHGPAGDKQLGRADALIKEVQKQKKDVVAAKEREEREKKRIAAIEAACDAVRAGEAPDAKAIGNEKVRIESAWQILVSAQSSVAAQKVDVADEQAACAFAIIPDSANAKKEACAPMRVEWTRILYQLGRMDAALKTVREGLACDKENPDAVLVEKQLLDLMKGQKGASAGAR